MADKSFVSRTMDSTGRDSPRATLTMVELAQDCLSTWESTSGYFSFSSTGTSGRMSFYLTAAVSCWMRERDYRWGFPSIIFIGGLVTRVSNSRDHQLKIMWKEINLSSSWTWHEFLTKVVLEKTFVPSGTMPCRTRKRYP